MIIRVTFICLLLVVAPLACAQRVVDVRTLAGEAGIIFVGTVELIQPVVSRARGDIGVVRVPFRVNDALRGASPGAALTITEWDGLWTAGDRYRVGENLLLFLYPPSGDLGLTSIVGGSSGRIAPSELSLADVARQIAEPSAAPPPRPTKPWRSRGSSPAPLRRPLAE